MRTSVSFEVRADPTVDLTTIPARVLSEFGVAGAGAIFPDDKCEKLRALFLVRVESEDAAATLVRCLQAADWIVFAETMPVRMAL